MYKLSFMALHFAVPLFPNIDKNLPPGVMTRIKGSRSK